MKQLIVTLSFLCFFFGLTAQRPGSVSVSVSSNSKDAVPVGVGSAHLIEVGTEITYTIYFQNNGTDTVYNFRILDTLSAALDLSTLRQESSSHFNVFTVEDGNALKVSFANIRLPNLETDEVASRGFVSYTVATKSNLPAGTLVLNDATLFFDFSTPITTNQVYHTISDNATLTNHVFRAGLHLNVYPNPATDRIFFEIEDFAFANGILELFSPVGQLLDRHAFSGSVVEYFPENFAPGKYFYKISLDGMMAATGVVMIK